jgi:hypothetical protein
VHLIEVDPFLVLCSLHVNKGWSVQSEVAEWAYSLVDPAIGVENFESEKACDGPKEPAK